jgi:preprotein translocase SecE subunit
MIGSGKFDFKWSAFVEKIRQLIQFFRDAAEELKKVSWLTRPQMLASTWLVILLVIVFSIFVGALDFIIAKSFHFLIS